MNRIFTSLIVFCSISLYSQTGPGGIGNSAGNVLWLDGNRGIETSGAAVISWDDQSGNSNNGQSSILVQCPQVTPGAVNGSPAVLFDGADDLLSIPDHSSLDLQEWHIFMVVQVAVHKNYNTWFAKGTYLQENYCLLSYANGNLRSPIRFTDGNISVVNSSAGQVTTTEYNIIEYSYSPAHGRDIYKNNSLVLTDNNYKIPAANNSPFILGYETGFGNRHLNGSIAEIIIYNERLTDARRLIINNYLAAKYDKALVSNDFYDEDNSGFDYEVAGIGRINGTDEQLESQGSGRVRMLNAADLNNNEFLLWGHDNGEMMAVNFVDVPPGVEARSDRIWRVSERNSTNTAAVNAGDVDIRFDLTGLGPVTETDLRLLIDTDDDGIFADENPLAGATGIGAGVYAFAAVPGTMLTDNRRFTIATINSIQTPLPVELLAFDVEMEADLSAVLTWQTASELNNDFFTIERSPDAVNWVSIGEVDGAGTSSTANSYNWTDRKPLPGKSYYRLRQTDFNGEFTYSETRFLDLDAGHPITVYPNPFVETVTIASAGDITQVTVYSAEGRIVKNVIADGAEVQELDLVDLPAGSYLLEFKLQSGSEFAKLVKK